MTDKFVVGTAIDRWKQCNCDYKTRLEKLGDNYTCRLLSSLDSMETNIEIEKVLSIREHTWECLHAVSWKDVDVVYRDLYATLSVLLVSLYLASSYQSYLKEFSKMCDMGLLLGSGVDCARLQELLAIINSKRIVKAPVQKKLKTSHSLFQKTIQLPPMITSVGVTSVEAVSNPGLVTFLNTYLNPQRPVVLKDVMKDWSAMTKWCDPNYFIEVGGYRTVPIETGSSYLNSDSGSKLVTLEEFIDKHILHSDAEVGYLAQHQLLKQIPELQKDIDIPDYCALLCDIDESVKSSADVVTVEEEDVKVQMWLGPVGTLSPLHHDCYYNLLCQVVGFKYVRLYHPDQSEKLHPMDGVMSNNSSIDLTSLESIAEYPSVREAAYSEYVLGPGEMLFIPRWHWHLVLAVDETTALDWRKQHLSEESAGSVGSRRCDQFSASISLWWGSRIEKTE